jgi:hypothetical protein
MRDDSIRDVCYAKRPRSLAVVPDQKQWQDQLACLACLADSFVLIIYLRRFAQIHADLFPWSAHLICENLCESADEQHSKRSQPELTL